MTTAKLGPSERETALQTLRDPEHELDVLVIGGGITGTGAALDAVCRESLAAAGLGEWFSHGTGHGVGLLIHEIPWATSSSTDTLRVRDVVTVEPGVYRRDLGGIRIEDTVVVTTDGCRPLTHTPKDLSCLRSAPTTSRPG